VSDFGLKVALNSVEPKKLRTMDIHNIEDSVLTKRMQVAVKSDVNAFGLNIEKDLLKAIIGQPKDENFGSLVAGRESLTLVTKILPSNLYQKCKEILTYYESKKYQKDFPWVDDIRPISDPSIIDLLNNKLLEEIKSKDLSIKLFPTDMIDYYEGIEFKYSVQKESDKDIYFDLEIEHLYEKAQHLNDWTVETLKKNRIFGRKPQTNEWSEEWRLIDCLSFELIHSGSTHILHQSEWYSVSDTLSKKVRNYTKRLIQKKHNLPKYKYTDSEGKYNKRLHNKKINKETFILFDRKLVRVEDASTTVEPCDLFSDRNSIYHLKKGNRSSSLSHLFSQAYVAGKCFLDSQHFRDHMNTICSKAGSKHSISSSPSANDYTIFYGILTSTFYSISFYD
jgi:uncharacterized protein (TIGR04141 family)